MRSIAPRASASESGVRFQAGGEQLPGRDRGEGPVGAEGDVPGFGEGEQARQGRGARRQRGVEVEAREVIQAVAQALPGVAQDADRHPVRGVGHESTGVAEDEPDIGVLAANPLRTSRYAARVVSSRKSVANGRDTVDGGAG